MSYALAFANQQESKFPPLTRSMDHLMMEQVRISKNQFQKQKPVIADASDDALPRTFEDAIRSSSRAIVITEAAKPFRIVDVNKAWEGLCGYTFVESKGKTLGSLLKGPETDPLATTALMSQLLKGEEAGLILTNYTKSGRKFQNRLRAGPIYDENGTLTHFVGVLQEMKM